MTLSLTDTLTETCPPGFTASSVINENVAMVAFEVSRVVVGRTVAAQAQAEEEQAPPAEKTAVILDHGLEAGVGQFVQPVGQIREEVADGFEKDPDQSYDLPRLRRCSHMGPNKGQRELSDLVNQLFGAAVVLSPLFDSGSSKASSLPKRRTRRSRNSAV
jgi:hypothetical protein